MKNQVAISILMVAASSALIKCQFLQPQSHLGRIVQSIASPLVLAASGDSSEGYGASPYYPSQGDESSEAETPTGRHNYRQHQQQHQSSRGHQALQQAPSQQRGVPRHYYDQEERDQGQAPSNSKGTQEYQMGAYLGPTIDDKEINGAFNSNNDDRDDDELPSGGGAGYQPQQQDEPRYSRQEYAPSSPSSGYERRPSNYDEDSADEDEPSAGAERGRHAQGRRYHGGLSQAASQYQQGHSGNSAADDGNSQMMTAANGYVPYGFNGPVDLSGLMAPGSGFQVYNGDGSAYPGANYYQQQQQAANQRRQPMGSSLNGMNYNGANYNNYQGQRPQQQGDNDEHENDTDED